MSSSCHDSSGSKQGNGRLKWWGIGGFVIIMALLWAFDGNPLVSQLAPLILLTLILIWLVVSVARRMGLRR
jgi:hypothetical protein